MDEDDWKSATDQAVHDVLRWQKVRVIRGIIKGHSEGMTEAELVNILDQIIEETDAKFSEAVAYVRRLVLSDDKSGDLQ